MFTRERSDRARAMQGGVSAGLLALLASLTPVRAAHAGCGCDKPPPPPAAVRPTVTYAGTPVSFFGASLVAGQQYTVTFSSGTTAAASVQGTAVTRRDLADGASKTQLVVTLPSLPLGPASIRVSNAGGSTVMSISDASFTVAPQPLAIPTDYGSYRWPSYRAAVGRDGVVYLSLDLTQVSKPIVFEAKATSYPLRFGSDDIVFYNVQGFLMQRLVQGTSAPTPVPGMFAFPAASGSADSDTLHYSRHEFSTYFLQHQERQPHQVDPSDGNWHMDGSRHVDHNHLILAIMGQLPDGSLPAPGATPAFDLAASNYSLFYQGLVGKSSVTMTTSSTIDSYTPGSSGFGSDGDVFTNGTLTMYKSSRIYGDATAAGFNVPSAASVAGTMTTLTQPATFMDIKVPDGIPNLGALQVNGNSATITGPGSFLVSQLSLSKGANLYIDNSAGPVTLYVTGTFVVNSSSTITVADRDPERFAVYMASGSQVNLNGGCSSFYGVVYAPYSPLAVNSNSEFYGAFVADSLTLNGTARVHYDSALRGQ